MSWIVRFFGFLEEIRVPVPRKAGLHQFGATCPAQSRNISSLCQPGRPAHIRSSISTPGKMASYRENYVGFLKSELIADFDDGLVNGLHVNLLNV